MKTNYTTTNTIKPGNEQKAARRRHKSAMLRNEIPRGYLQPATSHLHWKTQKPHLNIRQTTKIKSLIEIYLKDIPNKVKIYE